MIDAELGLAIRQYLATWLAWHDKVDRLERTADLERRVDGMRVVDGGQVGPDDAWEVKDAESGEILATGSGLASYESAWLDSWVHRDSIGNAAFETATQPTATFGLPDGFAAALAEWVVDRPGEARELFEP